MNERIRELAEQAYEDVIKNTPSFLVTKELYEQKFAELIVRECIDIVENQGAYMRYNYLAEQVRKHFGVKK